MPTKTSGSDVTLTKSIRSIDVIALAFGSMIGWGWIMLCGKWAVDGGMLGAIFAFIIGAVLCVFVGMTYAELTPAIPMTGGSVAFSDQALGKPAALISGLATTLAYLGVAAWEGPALVSSIGYIVNIPQKGYLWTVQRVDVFATWTIIAVLGAVVITVINILGVKGTAVFQTAATVGIIVVGLLFLSGSLVSGSIENARPMFTSAGGMMAVLLTVPAMLVGFDVIPQATGEMDVPLKKIPILLVISILAATAWYVLMILATCLSAPQSVRAAGTIPVADSMAYAFGNPFWGKVCIIGALFGIVTSWNGFLFGAARCLYFMASIGLLPSAFAELHPKYKTPYKAIIACGIVCALAALLGSGALSWFVNASSFGTVIMYAMVVIDFIVLRINKPELPRPFVVKNFKLVSVFSVIVVIFFIYLYLPMGPSSLSIVEWSIVLLWFATGTAISIICKKDRR